MRYLIFAYDNDLDTMLSAYLYSYFIEKAGFESFCYVNSKTENKKVSELFKKYNINLNVTKNICDEDKIIILTKKNIDTNDIKIYSNNVTEIISLKDIDFSKFKEANITFYPVSFLSTMIMKRYREYELLPTLDAVLLLNELYNFNSNSSIKITEQDEEIKKYVQFLYENRKNITS